MYEHWINGDIILKLSPSFAFLNISIIQENTEVEGALFVYSRSTSPTSAFFIMNRLNMNNLVEPISSKVEFKLQEPFLLYRNITKGIFGIWFYDTEECQRLATLLNVLSSQIGAGVNDVTVTSPTLEIPQGHQEAKEEHEGEEEKVDILQLFAKAQERYDNEKKPSHSGPTALQSTPSQKQVQTPERREQQEKFLQENLLLKEQLQRLCKNEPTRPTKPHTYSLPASFVIQGAQKPKGSGMENGLSPGREGQSSARRENLRKSVTLSDVKAPVGPESGPAVRTQDDSAVESSKRAAQRKLFHNEQLEMKNSGAWQVPLSQPTVIPQIKETPQKPSQDPNAMAVAPLISPLAFQNSAKMTVMTPPAQTKPPPAKFEIAPLTQEQLAQALTYLLKNDTEFVSKIHEAYFKSLQDKLPT